MSQAGSLALSQLLALAAESFAVFPEHGFAVIFVSVGIDPQPRVWPRLRAIAQTRGFYRWGSTGSMATYLGRDVYRCGMIWFTPRRPSDPATGFVQVKAWVKMLRRRQLVVLQPQQFTGAEVVGTKRQLSYPLPPQVRAPAKGRVVQFLEQDIRTLFYSPDERNSSTGLLLSIFEPGAAANHYSPLANAIERILDPIYARFPADPGGQVVIRKTPAKGRLQTLFYTGRQRDFDVDPLPPDSAA